VKQERQPGAATEARSLKVQQQRPNGPGITSLFAQSVPNMRQLFVWPFASHRTPTTPRWTKTPTQFCCRKRHQISDPVKIHWNYLWLLFIQLCFVLQEIDSFYQNGPSSPPVNPVEQIDPLIRNSVKWCRVWIESFVRLKKISVHLDDSAQQLTHLAQEQLATRYLLLATRYLLLATSYSVFYGYIELVHQQ
jgi:hypothetical protein